MIPIFDLDDTLYPEGTYVKSGFRAVSDFLEMELGWPNQQSLERMLAILEMDGRGAVFNTLLDAEGALTRARLHECIHVYRHHHPDIQLDPLAPQLLQALPRAPFLVTDGHKIVQRNKIDALALWELFDGIYITHRYGIKYAKPSIYCFDLIRRKLGCSWSEMCYVGDNPAKDFVSLNELGVRTVRVLTGEHASVTAQPGYEGEFVIPGLGDLESVWNEIS